MTTETIEEKDLLKLEVAREKINVSITEAKLAIANSENAKLQHQALVLQVYVKYGLKSNDTITEKGEIVRNPPINPQPESPHEENNTK